VSDRKYYLDGLRGWASLVVVIYHCTLAFPIDEYHSGNLLVQFFTNGALAVYVFFVLSGFALSIGFLETGDRGLVIASALRRYPRLTIPIAVSALFGFALMSLGAMYNQEAAALAEVGDWLGAHYAFPAEVGSLLQFALYGVYLDGNAPVSYNAVLWTMPIEMTGSMMVFLALYLAGRHRGRLLVYLALALAAAWAGSHLTAFMLGLALAELSGWPLVRRLRHGPGGMVAALVLLVLAFSGSTVFWERWVTPPAMSLIAAGLVLAVVIWRPLAGVFECRLSRRLGRLSFPLYLTHLPVLCSVSSYVYLRLAAGGLELRGCGLAVLGLTLALSLLAGALFEPVEQAAIVLSRKFSDFVIRRGARPAPAGDGLQAGPGL
jgi:peptidoglycan/LPS O-acetylase OafA/YrhL